MRRFVLIRHVDVEGVSGTGTVAEGVRFTDGTVVVRWLPGRTGGVRPTTVVHEDVLSVVALHGHAGSSSIVWVDADDESDAWLATGPVEQREGKDAEG